MDASLVGAGLGSFRGLEAHLPRPPSKNQAEPPGMGGSRDRDRRIGGFRNLHQKQQLREKCLGHEPYEGGTRSAGPAKKEWGSCWEVVVAMGVA